MPFLQLIGVIRALFFISLFIFISALILHVFFQSFTCKDVALTFWRLNYFLNFSTPCIQNVNNTGTKYVRIMKQTAFFREKTESIYRV